MSTLPDIVSPALPVFVQGLALSLGLIVAIGAQNAFVLRQGLRREHVRSVVLFCGIADALLITAGVMGMAQALGERPGLARALALAGAAFLVAYGWQAFRRARQSNQMRAADGGTGLSRGAAMAQAAAFTLLNPHVYLDTVLLVGSIGAQQQAALRGWFVAGASTASPPSRRRASSSWASTASRMPSPNSALSSKSEFDQPGPRPSRFTV